MVRLMRLLGSGLAFSGAVGLFLWGTALVGIVFDALTFRIASPPNPPPNSLADLQRAAVSAIALGSGLVVTCSATVMLSRTPVVSIKASGASAVAGGLLVVAALISCWGIMDAKASFQRLATSADAPTPESVEQMLRFAEPKLTFGYGMFVAAAGALVVVASLAFRKQTPSVSRRPTPLGIGLVIASAAVGIGILLLSISIGASGSEVATMISSPNSAPSRPTELARNLALVLNRSVGLFAGLAVLGLLHTLAPAAASSGNRSVASAGE